jgi:hypothetical protein
MCHAGLGARIRIHIILGIWIRIRIRVKSWIRMRIRIKNQNLGALEGQIGSVNGPGHSQWWRKDLKWSLEGSVDRWSQIRNSLVRSRIQICIEVKIRI